MENRVELFKKLNKLRIKLNESYERNEIEYERLKEELRNLLTKSSDLSASFTIGEVITPQQKEKVDVVIELVKQLSKDVSEKFGITFNKLDEIRDIQDENLMLICESLDKPLWEKITNVFDAG